MRSTVVVLPLLSRPTTSTFTCAERQQSGVGCELLLQAAGWLAGWASQPTFWPHRPRKSSSRWKKPIVLRCAALHSLAAGRLRRAPRRLRQRNQLGHARLLLLLLVLADACRVVGAW